MTKLSRTWQKNSVYEKKLHSWEKNIVHDNAKIVTKTWQKHDKTCQYIQINPSKLFTCYDCEKNWLSKTKTRQKHDKNMTKHHKEHDKNMTTIEFMTKRKNSWQKFMVWQKHKNTWQTHDKNMTKTWQKTWQTFVMLWQKFCHV